MGFDPWTILGAVSYSAGCPDPAFLWPGGSLTLTARSLNLFHWRLATVGWVFRCWRVAQTTTYQSERSMGLVPLERPAFGA